MHVRDAPKTDRLGGLHSRLEQPDTVIADFHGASERRQVHENQTVFDRDGVRSAIRRRNERCGILPLQLALLGYGMLLQCHPAAVRRGVGGFRVAKHLHLPVTLDKQAETAGRERDDAHIGERTERFWDGLIRRRVVLLATAGELDVAVDRDDASDTTQSEAVGCIRRLPLLGYGKLLLRVEDVDGNSNAIAQLCTACVPCDNLESFCRMTVRDHRDVVERWDFVFSVVHQLQFDGV